MTIWVDSKVTRVYMQEDVGRQKGDKSKLYSDMSDSLLVNNIISLARMFLLQS